MGLYNSNPDFTLHAKMVTALSFVPNDNNDCHVDALATTLPGELVSLLNWFENNYIGQHRRGTMIEDNHCFPQRCETCTNKHYTKKMESITMLK